MRFLTKTSGFFGCIAGLLLSLFLFLKGIEFETMHGGTGEMKDAAISGFIFSGLVFVAVILIGRKPKTATVLLILSALGLSGALGGAIAAIPLIFIGIAILFSFYVKKR